MQPGAPGWIEHGGAARGSDKLLGGSYGLPRHCGNQDCTMHAGSSGPVGESSKAFAGAAAPDAASPMSAAATAALVQLIHRSSRPAPGVVCCHRRINAYGRTPVCRPAAICSRIRQSGMLIDAPVDRWTLITPKQTNGRESASGLRQYVDVGGRHGPRRHSTGCRTRQVSLHGRPYPRDQLVNARRSDRLDP